MLPPKYAEDTITQYWVMANCSCIHYVPVWPRGLTYFILGMCPGHHDEDMCIFWSLSTFAFLKYSIIKCNFMDPLLSNRCCHGKHFMPLSLRVSLMLASSMKLIWPPTTELLQFLTGYVTWRLTLTFDPLTVQSCHVMPLGWSIPVPSLNWIRHAVPELWRLQLSIGRQLKVPKFTYFEGKWVKFQISSFWPPKGTTLARATQNDVFCVGVRPKM